MQNCTSLSTNEAEYIVAIEACKEAIWLTRLVGDLEISEILVLHYDSHSTIQLVKNLVFHAQMKHIDVRYHSVCQVLEDKLITLVKIHTSDNPVDLLTKTLPS